MGKGDPRIFVHVDPVPQGWALDLFRVLDDRGKEVEIREGQAWSWGQGDKVFGLKLSPEASRVGTLP